MPAPYIVDANSISFASALWRTLAHCVASPLPAKTTLLGFGGDPIWFSRGSTGPLRYGPLECPL